MNRLEDGVPQTGHPQNALKRLVSNLYRGLYKDTMFSPVTDQHYEVLPKLLWVKKEHQKLLFNKCTGDVKFSFAKSGTVLFA